MLLVLFAASSQAAGEPALPACPPLPAGEGEDGLRRLEALAPVCAGDADWHARRGALLLLLGRAAQAAESLERAILLAPAHAGARIDYADALAALGDLASARALAEEVLGYPDVPAQARRHLEARLADWRGGASAWRTELAAGAALGWESNLNGGPAADSIWLTLADGVVNLPLTADERPRAGFAMLYDAGLAALRPLEAEWRLLLRTQGRVRDAAAAAADYLLAQADVSLLHGEGDAGEWLLQAAHLEQRFGRSRLLGESRLSARYEWAGQACRPRLGVEHALRRFPEAATLDGSQWGLRLGLGCGTGPWQASADARFAVDRPQHAARPGGRQHWAELRLGAGWRAGPRALTVEAVLGEVRDAEGYSPLLEQNRRRQIVRDALRLELTQALSPGWELAVGMDRFRQRSALRLFELDNFGIYFGARFRG